MAEELETIHECMAALTSSATEEAKRTESGFNLAKCFCAMGPGAFETYGVSELISNAISDKGKTPDVRLGGLLAFKVCSIP